MAHPVSGSAKKKITSATSSTPAAPPGAPPPAVMDAQTWERVVRRLELAPQQARVVELVMLGKRDKQIAAALGLSVPTVRTYLKRVYQRVDVADRIELILRVFSVAREIEAGHAGASAANPCGRNH